MEIKKTFWLGFISFILILLLAFALNGILGIAGFETTYLESIIGQYTIQGEAAKNKIETSLNLGKKLYLLNEQYEEVFNSALRQNSGIKHFYIADTDNSILYTTRVGTNQAFVPFEIEHTMDLLPGEEPPSANTVKFLDNYYICIPLFSEGINFQGTLIVEFYGEDINAYIYKIGFTVFRFAVILVLCSLALYLVLSWIYINRQKAENFILILVLLGSQVFFAVHNNNLYNTIISDVFNKNMSVLSKVIVDELYIPLDYGIRIDNMGDTDTYLAKRMQGNPYCSQIYITDFNLNILYEARRDPIQEQDDFNRRLSRNDPDITAIQLVSNNSTGYLVLRINRVMINSILLDMAMDSMTIIVVTLIFSFILRDLFVFMSSRKALIKNRADMKADDFEKYGLRLIKISTFAFMFAAFITLSFMPLLIEQVYKNNPVNLFGLSNEFIFSLPMGSYMLGIVVSMFISIFFMKKFNIWKRHILITVVFIIGSVATIYSDTFILLTIARFITGMGFGGVLLNLTSLIMFYTSEKNRSVGFGTNAAAAAAASICSIPVGGIIVNKFGYDAGIMVSVGFALLLLIYSYLCMTSEKRKSSRAAKEDAFSFSNFIKVAKSKHVIVYILCVNIPFQLIYYGLFQFVLPFYMSDSLGLSQGNIGRILSIFCIVSLGAAFVSRLSDWAKNDKLLISIGAFIVGIVLIVFGLYPEGGLILFFAVLVGMGIDNLFIDAIEEVYLENGNIKNISGENLLQSYKVTEKIFSVFLPTMTGLLVSFAGFNMGLLAIGLWCVIGAAAFILLGVNGRWEKGRSHEN